MDFKMDFESQWMRCMRRGDWAAAWRISDRLLRARAGRRCCRRPRHQQSIWDGRPLAGQRVLVRCYHGLGDTVQFIRFAPRLRSIAAEVAVWAQPPLIPLLRTARGIDRLLPLHDGAPDLDYDVDIELMELPYALRLAPRDLPGEVPYLGPRTHAAPEGQGSSRRRGSLRGQGSPRRLRVGIVWQAGDWDPRRSIPLPLLEQHLIERTPGVSWCVMQRGPALAAWRNGRARMPRIDGITSEVRELGRLDLLVTVDTLSAHLAGALGAPVWTLLPAAPDWRWMQAGVRTPWYPTMRLWRQRPGEGWEPVLDRVFDALAAARSQCSSPAWRIGMRATAAQS